MSNKKFSSRRQLTVSYRHQPRAHGYFVSVPEIRLCGKWLKDAGFKEGSRVEVEVGSGMMVLKLVNG